MPKTRYAIALLYTPLKDLVWFTVNHMTAQNMLPYLYRYRTGDRFWLCDFGGQSSELVVHLADDIHPNKKWILYDPQEDELIYVDEPKKFNSSQILIRIINLNYLTLNGKKLDLSQLVSSSSAD